MKVRSGTRQSTDFVIQGSVYSLNIIKGDMAVNNDDAETSGDDEEQPASPSGGEEDLDEDYREGSETSSPNKRARKRKPDGQNKRKASTVKYTYSELYFDLTYDSIGQQEEEADSPDNFRFFATTKCKRLLYLKGYVYNLNRVLDKVTYWRCQQKSCCGCAVLKPKDGKPGVNWHEVNADKLVSSPNFNQNAHGHPPYRSFDAMVSFFDDRCAKLKKNIRVGGQRLGRYLREGEIAPKRQEKSAKKMRLMQEVLRNNIKWKKRLTNSANESNSFEVVQSEIPGHAFQLPETSGYEPQGSSMELATCGNTAVGETAEVSLVPEDTSALDNSDMSSNVVGRKKTTWDTSYSEKYYNLHFDETASTDQDSSPGPENFRFFATTKCKKLLYLNGFAYCLNRVRVVNSYWRCQIRGCCGCAVLKKEAENQVHFKDMKNTETLTVCKNFHQKLHCHPPFLSFDDMVQFFDDRWDKIKKNIKIGGQRFGRFIREGQPPPQRSKTKNKPLQNFGFEAPNNTTREDPETLANIVCQLYTSNKNGKVLFVEGSLYLLCKSNADRAYWRCRNRPCRATIGTRVMEGGIYRVIAKGGYHIHPMAETYEEALKERARVTKMVRERKEMGLSAPMIALEEERMGEDGEAEAANYFEQSLDPGIDTVDSDYSMGDVFDDTDGQMKEEVIVLEHCLTDSGEKFLREIVIADDGTKILVFVTGKNIEYLSAASTWAMDSVRGAKMPNLFAHLFIIRARVRYGEALPLAYALMTSGTQDAFRALFIDLKVMASLHKVTLNPVRILTEMEENVLKGCREVFHDTRVTASHYHLSKTIWDRANFMEMNNSYVDGESVKTTSKKLVALAFLPANKIEQAWKELRPSFNETEEPLINWFEEVFVLGPVLKIAGESSFHSAPMFPPSFWSQEPLLPANNCQQPFLNLQTHVFKEWHWKWSNLLACLESEGGVNRLIDILKREQNETEQTIGKRFECQDRHLLGEALSDVLANRTSRKSLDLVREISHLMDFDDPLPSASFSLEELS